jgi:ATP-dependent DNA helicase PIF1
MIYLNQNSEEALLELKTNKNIFLTGPPGSGKTYLINKFIEHNNDKVISITGSTGVASNLINGNTIHSVSGIGIINDHDTFDDILKKVKKRKTKFWKYTDILIIDEISLIDSRTFEYFDRIGQNIRKSNLPFGGIQLIVVGDFYQLPPVNGNYCFEYEKWENCFDVAINLTNIYRSNDNKLNKILLRIRKGKELKEKMIKTLENKVSDEIKYPILVPLRKQASNINNKNMLLNKNEEKIFNCEYYYNQNKKHLLDLIKKNCPYEENLKLKIGSPVINLVNDSKKGLYNGQVGIIKDFIGSDPLVCFNNYNVLIKKHLWTKEIKEEKIEVIGMEQYPLLLSYAITIHRSQGQSLSQAGIILDSSVWEKGQGYVALSRLQNLDGLNIIKFNPNIFKIDSKVKKYYKKFK